MKICSVLMILPVILGGCATVIEGTSKNLTVNTDPAGAICAVNRNGVLLGTVNPTPGSIRISKSKDDIAVTCDMSGHSRTTVSASPKFVGTTFGNILLGGIVGVIVDAASGANYDPPDQIAVALPTKTVAPTETAELPTS